MTEHNHPHDTPHPGTAQNAEPGYYARRVRALEAALVQKGVCTTSEVERAVHEMELRSPADGGRVVARAWVDPGYKARLLANGKPAVAEMGYDVTDDMPELVVVENTDQLRYLVVCTLCSCYPRWLLGRPPDWYKSFAYRSRTVVEPWAVMREFGLEVDEEVEVRVVDSTADLRYLVLPRRPAGTDPLSEEELARLVTRDSMVGMGDAVSP